MSLCGRINRIDVIPVRTKHIYCRRKQKEKKSLEEIII